MSTITIEQLTALVEALRNETELNSVTPERVGYPMQKIIDFLENYQTVSESEKQSMLSQIQAEIEARQSADTTLQNSITSGFLTEQTLRSAKDSELETAIAGEKSARESADASFGQAMMTESSERQSADSALQASIAAESEAREQAIASALATEQTIRAGKDSELESAISAEAQAREQADSDLQGAVSAEAQAREQADRELATAIAEEKTAREGVAASFGQAMMGEAGERQAADSALQESIEAEAQAREAADSAMQASIEAIEAEIADGVGTVKGVTVNGKDIAPDADGVVHIIVEDTPADESLDSNSTNPIQNQAVAQKLSEIEAKTLNDVEAEEGEGVVTLYFKNKTGGQIASVEIPATGGGGGGESGSYTKIQLSAAVDNAVIKQGGNCTLAYSYNAVDSEGNNANVRATILVEVKRGAITVLSKEITEVGRGTYEMDLSSVLSAGAHDINVKATITDPETGTKKSKTAYATVYVSSLTLASGYSLTQMAKDGGLSGQTVTIPYTVSGAGNKTIKLYVNGVQQQTQTQTLSGTRAGEFAVSIGGLTPGRHSVQMVAEATIDGIALTSESIYIDIIKSGLTGPWTAVMLTRADGTIFATSANPAVMGGQYEPVELKFAAYDPESQTADVRISIDGVQQQAIAAPRAMQTLSMRFEQKGTHEISLSVNGLTSGMARRRAQAVIAESSLGLSIAQAGLTHQFSASGRSNSEADPAVWKNQADPESANMATFTGVDWATSGWTGEALKLMNGAKAVLGVQPFAADAKATGLTIEIIAKVDTVTDKSAALISCLYGGKGIKVTAKDIAYLTGQTVQYTDENGNTGTRAVGLETKYASGDWMRIAFSITAASDRRLMELYIDGNRVGADIYDANFDFRQDAPQGLAIDSEGAQIEVRRVRMYSRGLTDDELLENSIVEADTSAEMMQRKEDNDVLDDESGDIDLTKVLSKGRGVLRIVRQGKLDDVYETNNKKTDFLADVYYWPSAEARAKGAKSFVAYNCYIRIQGTSSTKYPSKNLRIYLSKGSAELRLLVDGVEVSKKEYALRDGTPAQSVLCAKSDYSDSSMSLNTGGAKMWNESTKELGLLTPPQQHQKDSGEEVTVRQAIDGWPIDVFAADTVDGASTYYGQYNLNNEKSKSGKLFGMEGVDGFYPQNPIALETLNNTEAACLFQPTGEIYAWLAEHFDDGMEVNYSTSGTDGDVTWAGLSDGEQEAVARLFMFIKECVPAGADPNDIETWVSDKFKDEADQYLAKRHLLTYYVFTDYWMSVDQRAKNILWRVWDTVWYATYYDGDTQMGKRNDSFLVYDYSIDRETWDAQASKYAFEGRDSWLWNLCLANFAEEMADCAAKLREVMTTERVLSMLNKEQSGAWSDREFNKSGELKYIAPALQPMYGDHTWPFIYALQGANRSHREYIIRNRFALLDAKYCCGDYRDDNIDLYLAQAEGAISTLAITPSETYAFAYGTNNRPYIQSTGITSEMSHLGISGAYTINDPLRVYGASRMLKLDLKGLMPNVKNGLVLDKCAALEELDMSVASGSAAATAWFFTAAGCKQLRKVTLTGQTQARTGSLTSSAIDLGECTRLTEFRADGTEIEHATFAPGCPLTLCVLPATMKSLVLDHLPSLAASGLTLQGKQNLRSISILGCPQMADSHELVIGWLNQKTTADAQCSLTLSGMAWTGVTAAQMIALGAIGELDLEGTVALTATPTAEQAMRLMEIYGEGCFGTGSRLRINAPGGFMIAAPESFYEGVGLDDAVVAKVVVLDEAMENVSLTATPTGNVSAIVDTDAMTVTMYGTEDGASGKSVLIAAAGNLPGESRTTVTTTVNVLARVYPASFTLDCPSTATAGQSYVLTLEPSATPGVNGEWTTVWSVSGTDKVTLSEQTATSCRATVAADAEIEFADITASVFKNNGTSAYKTYTAAMDLLTADVLMTSRSNPEVMAICYAQGWAAHESHMTYAEASAVTNAQIANFSFRNTGIKTFNEFRYFTSITTFSGGQSTSTYFQHCTTLTEITLPWNLATIPAWNFLRFCSNLRKVVFGPNVTSIAYNCISDCPNLERLYFYSTVAPSGNTSETVPGANAASKNIYVPVGATGYDSGAYKTLQNNGWILNYTL